MMLSDLHEINVTNAAISGTGGSSTAVDVSDYISTLLLHVNARTGGTGAMTVAVEHSDTSGGIYAAVSAAAIVSLDTGEPATFANVSTTAYNATLGLRKDLLKKYVRVTFAGSGLTHNVAVVLVGEKRDSSQ